MGGTRFLEGFVYVGKKGFIECNVKLNYKPHIHFSFFIRTKFIRTSTLRLSKKAKNNFRLQSLFVLKFDLCS